MKTANRSSRGFVLALVAIFVTGLGVVAVLANSRTSELARGAEVTGIPIGSDVESTAPLVIDGAPLVEMPASGVLIDPTEDPAIGEIAPTVRGTDFSGNEQAIAADGRGKAILFLAHWCPDCQREVSLVVDLLAASRPEGFDLIAVSTAVDSGAANYPPNAWLATERWSDPIIRDSALSEGLRAYGGGGFPYVVYLDGDNRVVGRSSGELDEATIRRLWSLTIAQR
ncbi:MAG: thiol-disulfide isomerase/thioredoxin [Acidimicrobiales bacterium]|jgi:thiol-disulfide isomerase/thioredoxin